MNVVADINPTPNIFWFVISTRSGKEFIASGHLQKQGFRTFLPMRREAIRHGSYTATKLKPLFPNYIFASFEAEPAVIRSISGTRGVKGILKNGEKPTPLPDGFVDMLAANVDVDGSVSFATNLRPGDRIEFTSGPFARQVGELLTLDPRGRVRVLLGLLGSHFPVQASIGDIVPQ